MLLIFEFNILLVKNIFDAWCVKGFPAKKCGIFCAMSSIPWQNTLLCWIHILCYISNCCEYAKLVDKTDNMTSLTKYGEEGHKKSTTLTIS